MKVTASNRFPPPLLLAPHGFARPVVPFDHHAVKIGMAEVVGRDSDLCEQSGRPSTSVDRELVVRYEGDNRLPALDVVKKWGKVSLGLRGLNFAHKRTFENLGFSVEFVPANARFNDQEYTRHER